MRLPAENEYTLLLCTVLPETAQQHGWEAPMLGYAMQNIAGEILPFAAVHGTVQYYVRDGRVLLAVVGGGGDAAELAPAAQKLLETCRSCLGCETTIYRRGGIPLAGLGEACSALEEADRKNVGRRGLLLTESELIRETGQPGCRIDLPALEQLLCERRGAQAVELLRRETERLRAGGQLSYEALHRIHEDYRQLVYALLYRDNIQAHELFLDAASQALFEKSEQSAFDMIRWASAITAKMLSCQAEVRKTETVIDVMKRYIQENYSRDITRDEIAASVFLSPDYAAKLFKTETGVPLRDYVNEVRILHARQLLAEDKLSVSEVAVQVGLDNFSYFSTLFRKATGLSPREYRQQAEKTAPGRL